MIQPLKIENKLAPQGQKPLQYSVAASLRSGAEITLADPRATRALVALMDMQAVLGGAASHWGGPSGFAELMSALHAYVFAQAKQAGKAWNELFHLINDAGHCENGLYALKANYGLAGLDLEKLKGFRSIESVLTGHGESHLFPEAVYLSNGPLGSSLPQAQGLAAADALAGSQRVTVTAISDGACMEGEAKEALAAIPGFASKGKMAPFVLIISDNNTKLSGRIDDDAFSMNPSFAALDDLGWEVMYLKDGHDLKKALAVVEEAVEKAQANPKKPVAIHAKTIKGYGVKATAESASGGHGFPLKKPEQLKDFLAEIYAGADVPAEFLQWTDELIQQAKAKSPSGGSGAEKEKVQVGVSQAMIKMAEQGLPVVSVSADLQGSTGVADFHKKFPEQSFDVGVSEANMVSMAAGFSKQGYIPVVDTFSQFGVSKGSLPLLMAALSEAPVIAVFSHAGFQDAADGASHQALSYFAQTAAIPHTDIFCLSCSSEAENLMAQAIADFSEKRKQGQTPFSKIFFLGRETFVKTTGKNVRYVLGRAQTVYDSSDKFAQSVTLAAPGPLLFHALEAAKNLEQHNTGAVVIHPSIINRPDLQCFSEALAKTQGRLVTVEDHQAVGGFGALLTHALVQAGIKPQLISLGVKDDFGRSAYKADQLYSLHEVDHKAIAAAAMRFFN